MSENYPSEQRRGLTRVAIVGIIAGMAICLFAAIFTWAVSKPSFTVSDELDVALRQVIKGDTKTAVGIVKKHQLEDLDSDVDRAKKLLVEGIDAWEESQRSLEHQASFKKAEEALERLQKAATLGFPQGYEGLGNYVLGMVHAMLRQGKEALGPLRISAVRWPNDRSMAIGTIIDILLQEIPPAIDQAEEELNHWLSLPALGPDDLERATLARAKIHASLGDVEKAIEKSKAIPKHSDSYVPSQLLISELLRNQGLQSNDIDVKEKLLQDALELVRELNDSPEAKPPERRESLYMTGLLLRDLGRLDEALSFFASIRLGFPETPESLAAGIEEIEIAIAKGHPEQAKLIADYYTKHLGKPELYLSHRFRPEQFRERLNRAGRTLIQGKHFEEAAAYADVLPNLCTLADRLRIQADAFRGLAEEIASEEGYVPDRTGVVPGRLSGAAFARSRPYFRRAGVLYDRLSMQELRSNDYAEILWHAIECHQLAKELEQCNELLDRYINIESRARRPRAILAKGENALAANQPEKALASFQLLIQNYPENPLTYRARILSAEALVDQQRFDAASEMLLSNLYEGKLTPESPVWRDSLFQLGGIHYQNAERLFQESRKLAESKTDPTQRIKKLEESHLEYRNTIRRFEEALQRFPEDDRANRTMYLVGQSYKMASIFPKTILDENLISVEDKRKIRVQENRDFLESSKKVFHNLRKKIHSQSSALEIGSADQAILRNCYFREADLAFELKDYEEALTSYRNVANQFFNEPEALEALVQISRCHELLGNQGDAKQALLQAQNILKSIPAEKEARFLEATRFDRKQWDKHLSWLASLK